MAGFVGTLFTTSNWLTRKEQVKRKEEVNP